MLSDSSHARRPHRDQPRRATAALLPALPHAPLLALLLALLFSLLVPVVAHAHGALRRAVPASNARLSVVPRELRLTFTERVELPVARLSLAGPDGAAVALGPLTTVADSATVIVTAIRGALTAGAYTVTWQVAGRDGHPVRGRYTFTVLPEASGLAQPGVRTGAAASPEAAAPPAAPVAGATAGEAGATVTAPGQAPPPAAHHPTSALPAAGDFDAESPAYVAVRWLTYVALLVVLGAVAFRMAVLGLLRQARGVGDVADPVATPGFAADAERRAAAIGLWGALALLVAAVARLGAQSVAMHGAAEALDASRIGGMLRHTVWGWGWLLQIGGVTVAVLGFGVATRRVARRAANETTGAATGVASGAGTRGAWTAAAVAALLLAFTPALSGHAAAAPRLMPLAVLSDGLHVLGAGGWLGSLLVVLVAGLPAAFALGAERRGAGVAALVHAFSPVALGCAGVVAATGLFAGWLQVGRLAALGETDYGRVLLLKLGLLAPVAALGAYNWRRVRPALDAQDHAQDHAQHRAHHHAHRAGLPVVQAQPSSGDADREGGDRAPRRADVATQRLRRATTLELVVGLLVLLTTAVLVATPTPIDAPSVTAGAVPTP